MDFFEIKERSDKKDTVTIYPDFLVGRSQDLMVRGKGFYAIWDPEKGLWSTDEYDVQRFVDAEVARYRQTHDFGDDISVRTQYLSSYSSKKWGDYRGWVSSMADNAHQLDETITFADAEPARAKYASKRLPYSLSTDECPVYEELVSTLYDPVERSKLEWAIGAILDGASRDIQKFIVLYGAAGSGKSTILNIVQMLFQGYYTTFDAKALGSSNNAFATEVFKGNPLVAIEHDGDLSRIEDNTRLNSIVAHEEILINEKFKAAYPARINAFLFVGSNKPVKITDAKSGLIRRLIDVTPSGRKLPPERYFELWDKIESELGAIANHCLKTYRSMGRHFYDSYKPIDMMLKTDVFYNFVSDVIQDQAQDGISLTRAYSLYKEWCDETLVEYRMPRYRFREELKNYFASFEERVQVGNDRHRNWYSGLLVLKLEQGIPHPETPYVIEMKKQASALDKAVAGCSAQYANEKGTPESSWDNVETTLSELETSRLHYVRVPVNHIVIDFDIRGADGNKDQAKNLAAASDFPPTYAEWSKSGAGIHLHYIYDGDPELLAPEYAPGIEVKVFKGKASLRRQLSECNDHEIEHISEGLPLRKEKEVLNKPQVSSEKALRDLVIRNLRKEIHPGTKPSMDFIEKILDDAYSTDLVYDLTDLRPQIMTFAMGSTHQRDTCIATFLRLKLQSKSVEDGDIQEETNGDAEGGMVFFDLEVYPNLFVCCWKAQGSESVVRMVNPTPREIEPLLQMKLIGFNNRKYDNHILYGRYMGYTNQQLFELSQRLISNDRDATFASAWDLSYTDIYDFSTKKQSLKKFEIELGIKHVEMDIPWDEEVPRDKVDKVVEYCVNDVIATEKVFENRSSDWKARQVLAAVSGLNVNATTNNHTQQIIFGGNRKPPFVHTDLSKQFPGYEYSFGKSTYKGIDVGEGGLVRAKPGFYRNVALLDVASMHPTSLVELECFGEYTVRVRDLLRARLAVKHHDHETAGTLLGGALAPFLGDDDEALAFALKIAINSVYGLTAAKFPTRCNGMDPMNNQDNIVAKRGALFMVDLEEFIESHGFTVAHIKTDSVKIPDATPEIIEAVFEFGKKYGYTFEHEATYDKFCLVNDAVYVAHSADHGWTATGTQFLHPAVFKSIFTDDVFTIDDLVETRTVKTRMYLQRGDTREFIGRVGAFLPVKEKGAELVVEREGKFHAVSRTKGYSWLTVDQYKGLYGDDISKVNWQYYAELIEQAQATLEKFQSLDVILTA